MRVKHLRHLPLFEHFNSDQDEEDVKEVERLPYFNLISGLHNKQQEDHNELTTQLISAQCWIELEDALSTCAYLGTDEVAKLLIARALWRKTKTQLENILDFRINTWKPTHFFMNNYLGRFFEIHEDDAGKIHAGTRVQHCWTDAEIHPISINTWDAAFYGNLNTLISLYENGFPWDADTCAAAAQNGHLQCLTYAHENGCPWDGSTSYWAATNGQLKCLKYAHENGCPWNIHTCETAARNGHLNCLIYAHENGCPWNILPCEIAAQHGQLKCLKYAHENGCPWDIGTCTRAAAYGHLNCLIYAHENGCAWDERTCFWAARKGHLPCLKYAHENGCPWNEETCYWATINDHLDCLTYAHENGCPSDKTT